MSRKGLASALPLIALGTRPPTIRMNISTKARKNTPIPRILSLVMPRELSIQNNTISNNRGLCQPLVDLPDVMKSTDSYADSISNAQANVS